MRLPSRKDLPLFIFSLALPQLAGLIGSIFTFSEISNWYIYLAKPSITPPDFVFGPVWTILYILMGIAFYIILKNGNNKKLKKDAVRLFILQLVFNTLWSVVFFGMHSPLAGVLVIVSLLFLIILTIKAFYKISHQAAILLLPYLFWVSFATVLNFWIYILN